MATQLQLTNISYIL